jgi:phytanoyl-CoA hydroxylase
MPTRPRARRRSPGLADIAPITGADEPDEARNGLTPVAGPEVPAILDPGDVVFFHGHALHRSHPNRSATRSRRSFVAHYCNARSYVPWDNAPLADGEMANARHVLARGTTHLPCAEPRFRTTPAPVAR